MNSLNTIYCSNINAICHVGGFFAPARNHSWSNGTHSFVQNKFYFFTKGKCNIVINGTKYTATAGDWFFIPAGTPHSYSKIENENFEKYWMHFELFPSTDFFSMLELPYLVKVEKKHNVYNLFGRFAKAVTSEQFADKFVIKSILFELISEYIKLAKPDGISIKKTSDDRLYTLFRYIDQNLNKNITLNELSNLIYMTPNHLIRFFKKKTGFTPAKYMFNKKMERAKTLLESTLLPINEIMEEIGMEDAGYFSRSFKSAYSMSPRAYRDFYKGNLKDAGIVKD